MAIETEKRDPRREPKTRREWQDAVDLAEASLRARAAWMQELLAGEVEIDLEACLIMLKRGDERGILPAKAGVRRAFLILIGAGGEQR